MAKLTVPIRVEFTQEEVRLAYERVRDLEAALRALTAAEPLAAGDVAYYCVVCEGVSGRPSDPVVVHREDCPWVRAKALLAGGGDAPGPAGTSTVGG